MSERIRDSYDDALYKSTYTLLYSTDRVDKISVFFSTKSRYILGTIQHIKYICRSYYETITFCFQHFASLFMSS